MKTSYEPPKFNVITKDLLLSLANEQQKASRRRKNIAKLEKIEDIRIAFLSKILNYLLLKLNNF